MTPPVTRFAPSPTGPLHLGHAFAALYAHDAAAGGRFLLRIEDLDRGRSRAEYEQAIHDDLAWLGLTWEMPVMRQSERADAYRAALDRLEAAGLLYPCFCTRKEIQAEIAASAAAPHGPGAVSGPNAVSGPEGPVYPGTCRALSAGEREERIAAGAPFALRLDMGRALKACPGPLSFEERGAGPGGETGVITAAPEPFGDVVLARKDAAAAYHLACVVDDAEQGVTLVTRGEDLFAATHLHRLLQALLGLPVPAYAHHRLIRDETGRRLAKRDDARALATLREQGASAEDVRRMVGAAAPPPGGANRLW
ncbi:MAG: tRNA glutamyl-Q(34) synthetase GluQRS [Alphaproteobacteria bacterium]